MGPSHETVGGLYEELTKLNTGSAANYHITLSLFVQKQGGLGGLDIQTQIEGQSLLFDDLAVEIEDEYNPMIPNNYEKVIRERREEHDRIRETEVRNRILEGNYCV